MKDYWEACIDEAFEDAKIEASDEQTQTVISWVEGAYENYGMANGHDCIPNPLQSDVTRLEKELRDERDKIICEACGGKGWITSNSFSCNRSVSGECSKCRGEGRYLP